MSVPTLTLPTGATIPQIAYGTGSKWMKGSDDESIDRSVVDAIKMAIELGYRHLDCAQYYNTEPELGLALKECGVPRSELFITTKAESIADPEGALRTSLQKMGIEYVDLYLIHHPFEAGGKEEPLQAAWRAMESCVDAGLARHIGVSNFLVPHLEAVARTARVPPAVNQIELHPYLQRPALVAHLRAQGTIIEAYAALGPLTGGRGGPLDAVCARVAAAHAVNESAVLLRWVIQRGCVAVSTSSRRERLQEYLAQVPSFELSAEEMEEIEREGRGKNFRGYFVDAYGEDCFD